MGYTYMKKCSTSLIIRKAQIKTTVSYDLTPVRWLSINQQKSAGEDVEKRGTLTHCWWECRLVQLLWKTVWSFLKKLKI